MKRYTPFLLLIAIVAVFFGAVAYAFIGPTATPPSGSGSLYLDSNGNLGIGTTNATPTNIASGKFFSVGTTTNPGIFLRDNDNGAGKYVIYVKSNGDLAFFDDTNNAERFYIATSGDVYAVGNIYANAFVGSLSGALNAANVSSGVFGSLQGNGAFAFPASLGVATSSQTGLPATLSVYGSGLFTGTSTASGFCLAGTCKTSWADYWLLSDSNLYASSTGWKVGIGTTTPSYALTVTGEIYSTGSSTASAFCISGVCQTSWNNLGQWTSVSGGIYYSGNASVGTTTVGTYPLYISSSTDNLFAFRRQSATYPTIFKQGTDGVLVVSNANTDTLTLKDGLVGIGTTNPGQPLSVASSSGITADFTGGRLINLGAPSATTDAATKAYVDSATASATNYWSLSGTYLYPTSTGYYVGIGTTTPAYNLSVVGTGYFSQPVIVGTPVADEQAATKAYVDTALLGAGTNYWTLATSSLYPTSTSYAVGIGTTTPSGIFTVGSTPSIQVNSTGQVVFGRSSHLNSTSTAFAIVNASSTATALTIYQQTPTLAQDIFTICRGAVTTNCQQRVLYVDQYGQLVVGQANSTGQFTVNAQGNFQQVITFANTHTGSSAGTKLTLSSSGGGQNSLVIGGTQVIHIGNNQPQKTQGSVNVFTGDSSSLGNVSAFFTNHSQGGGNAYESIQYQARQNNTFGQGHTSGADVLLVAGGNLNVINPNLYGAGLGPEVFTNTAPSAATWTVTSGCSFSGNTIVYAYHASGCDIRQTFANMATPLKPNTYYALTYTISSVSGTHFFYINDPQGTFLLGPTVSVQHPQTNAMKYGGTNYGTLSNGTHTYFFKTAPPAGFSTLTQFTMYTSSSQASGGFTITSLSLKEAGGGQVITGLRGGLLIGTSTPGLSGITVYGSSTTASDWSLHTFKSDGTSTFVVKNDGNIGIASSTPGYNLTVTGTGYFSQPVFVGTPTDDGHAATKSYVDGAVGGGQYWTLNVASSTLEVTSSTYDIVFGNGVGTDLIIGSGNGKIDVGTVDPVYTIGGKRYATYLPSMTGVKEETAGAKSLKCKNESDACSYTINFNELEEGSDLWLFMKTTNLKKNFSAMTVLLTPSFEGGAWYRKDTKNFSLTLYGKEAGEVSYRFTAPRFDWEAWPENRAIPGEHEGFNLDKLIFSTGEVNFDLLIKY